MSAFFNQCHSITSTNTRCKRKSLPGRRYCWQHDKAFFRNFTILSVLTILLTITGFVADIIGIGFIDPISINTNTPDGFSLSGLYVGKNNSTYRIEIVAFNSLNRDIFVKEIKITGYSRSAVACCCGEGGVPHFVIDNKVQISSQSEDGLGFIVPVHPKNSPLSNFPYHATGIIEFYCDDEYLELNLDSSFTLASNSYTSFLIDIPSQFSVTDYQRVGASLPKAILEDQITPKIEKIGIALMPEDIQTYEYELTIIMITDIGEGSITKIFDRPPSK